MPSALWHIYHYIVTNSKIEEKMLTIIIMPKNGKYAPGFSSITDATAINGFASWAPLRRTSSTELGVIRGRIGGGV